MAAHPCALAVDQAVSDALQKSVSGVEGVDDGGPFCGYGAHGETGASISVFKPSQELRRAMADGTSTWRPIAPSLGDASGWQPFNVTASVASGGLRIILGDKGLDVSVVQINGTPDDALAIARRIATACLPKVSGIPI